MTEKIGLAYSVLSDSHNTLATAADILAALDALND
jgi:hypothetical protein